MVIRYQEKIIPAVRKGGLEFVYQIRIVEELDGFSIAELKKDGVTLTAALFDEVKPREFRTEGEVWNYLRDTDEFCLNEELSIWDVERKRFTIEFYDSFCGKKVIVNRSGNTVSFQIIRDDVTEEIYIGEKYVKTM